MPSPQRPAETPGEAFAALPDPGSAGTLDDLVERLRSLKSWAGNPSFGWIKGRVNESWIAAGRPADEVVGATTVKDCFRPGRRRLNTDLVIAVVQALHPDTGYVTQWRQALRVIAGEARAATQVLIRDVLPPDLPEFTGRHAELDRLREALHRRPRDGGATAVATITGMAGVGKTQLAIRAACLAARDQPFDRILWVDLRGFHTDPAQPPADPAAVLEGFLRLLGVPGTRIPHEVTARRAAYRDRLEGSRTLVVLDNAADTDQVRPLLPGTPGCPVLITSRRSLTDLRPGVHLTVNVFSPDEALAYLALTAPQVPAGHDPHAAARITHRCGYLPLALGLVTAHIRNSLGWTLTDHADRLDERLRDRRLDAGVQLALDLSYQHLPTSRKRMLRLVALHPGQDLDAYAAAALSGCDHPLAEIHLRHLCGDHLLRQVTPGRYVLHDLVRAYAASHSSDHETSQERRAALTRLFDFYLATASAAMDTLYPAEAHRRPRIPPPGTTAPDLTDLDTARAWLDTERPTLVAVAAHAATHDWPTHAAHLSTTLYRYLDDAYPTDAVTVHSHAVHATRHAGDSRGQAHALTSLGCAHDQLGRREVAAAYHEQARYLFRQADDPVGEARALNNLAVTEDYLGRIQAAAGHLARALVLFQKAGYRPGEAHTLNNLGDIEGRLGRHEPAVHHLRQALSLFRHLGDRVGEAWTLNSLGRLEVRLGRHEPASDRLHQALSLYRQIGGRVGEAATLDNLGILHTRLGRPTHATEHHKRVLDICREIGDRGCEASAYNGLGEAAHTAGQPTDALTHHTHALSIATDIGDRCQQARAHTGLGHAHQTLAGLAQAVRHYHQALTAYTDLGMPDADRIRVHLKTIDTDGRFPPDNRVCQGADS